MEISKETREYLYREYKKVNRNRSVRYSTYDRISLFMQVIVVLMGISVIAGILSLMVLNSLNW